MKLKDLMYTAEVKDYVRDEAYILLNEVLNRRDKNEAAALVREGILTGIVMLANRISEECDKREEENSHDENVSDSYR